MPIIQIICCVGFSRNQMSSNSTSTSSLLRLPSEIRLKIYRLLLLSNVTLRMRLMKGDDSDYPPNCLYLSILSTCQLVYYEAMSVLYGENVFRAQRIDDAKNNAALIMRIEYVIGIMSAKDDALHLERFLKAHPNLKLLMLDFGFYPVESSEVQKILSIALFFKSVYSTTLRVRFTFQFRITSYQAAHLMEMAHVRTLRRNDFSGDF